MEETNNYSEEKIYLKAKKRVEELKKFYKHVAVYLIVNIFISSRRVMRNLDNGESLYDTIFDYSTYGVWFFWGIAIVLQAFKLFGLNSLFGANWEKQKVRELMDKRRNDEVRF